MKGSLIIVSFSLSVLFVEFAILSHTTSPTANLVTMPSADSCSA